jgi:lysophospholipase L1-like esterase
MPRLRRWIRRAAAGGVALTIALSLSAAMSPRSTSIAGAATATPAFYLDLGASVSVGVQPTPTDPKGHPTIHGYANDLVAMASANGVNLALTRLGCPGESVDTFINGGDRCYTGNDTQLSDALAFLRAHHDQTGLVTIDLGFNTIAPCFDGLTFDATCLSQKFATLQPQLSQVVASLKAAAGPNVTFIGVGHYDPFYASALSGASGQAFAAASVNVMRTLNDVLQSVYSSFNVPFARVAKAFSDHAKAVVPLANGVTVSGNVAAACTLTWMCAPAPFGPNIHPTDAGYQVIAKAIAALIPSSL